MVKIVCSILESTVFIGSAGGVKFFAKERKGNGNTLWKTKFYVSWPVMIKVQKIY
jgi:hypothetical protein